MEHTEVVSAAELEAYASTIESEQVLPELIWLLVQECPQLTLCRIPYGDSINQPGYDGLVETSDGFRQFIPKNKSYWEIGTGGNPQQKATEDFKKRLKSTSKSERMKSAYVFATALHWDEPKQARWLKNRKKEWLEVKILDGILIADWLREFPAVGKWLRKRIGLSDNISGFVTPIEHWENLKQLTPSTDPRLPPEVFLVGREQALDELKRIFQGITKRLIVTADGEFDAEDFVAAYLATLDVATLRSLANRCLFVRDPNVWCSLVHLKNAHVLVAHPKLSLENSEQLLLEASKHGHSVILPISSNFVANDSTLVPLRYPSRMLIENTLKEHGFSQERAQKLAEIGRLSLGKLKRHLLGLSEVPSYASWESAKSLALAALFGQWHGENSADQAAMENVLGKSYGEWIETVRPDVFRQDTPLTQRNENWKITSRSEAWAALGPRLSNLDLERFLKVAVRVLGEKDPALELPPDQRFAASLHGKKIKHSEGFRTGVAETLALLGSRPKALTQCTLGLPESIAHRAVRDLLHEADWRVWASIGRLLPMLAEAAPQAFLDATENALADLKHSPFNDLFDQEQSGVLGRNYTSGLLWSLETLAWNADFLGRATTLLGELAAIDPGGKWANRPVNSLIDIYLPWHPQTCAPVSKRKIALENLYREQPDVGWNVLLALLPSAHRSTSGTHKAIWRDLIAKDWTEKVTVGEYREQIALYAGLIVQAASVDLTKLAVLICKLPDIPSDAQSKILDHLSSDKIRALTEDNRTPLWEALIDLSSKHKKYPKAQWALPSGTIEKIESVSSLLEPKSVILKHLRLFGSREFDLFEESGDYTNQLKKLGDRRQEAIVEILEKEKLGGVIELARKVSSPEKVGLALGFISSKTLDHEVFPKLLDLNDKILTAFLSGFSWGRIASQKWTWVDSIDVKIWTVEQIVKFLVYLPFDFEAWSRAANLLGENVNEYWKLANVNPWGRWDQFDKAAEMLLRNGRPLAAISCLRRLVHEKASVSSSLVEQALLEAVAKFNDQNPVQNTNLLHDVVALIKWLQENESTNGDKLFQIEWAYITLLDDQSETTPKTLERHLAEKPGFFCKIIQTVFWSDKDKKRKLKISEERKAIARNGYRLLTKCKIIPGSTTEGSIDENIFNEWLREVKRKMAESGHLRVSMSHVGQVLQHSPKDPNGLWIHTAVAKALNAKDASEMRRGFTQALFNSRGVHGFTAGAEERSIAAEYNWKADALEEHGFTRFAVAMRDLANRYEQDAEIEAHRMDDELD